MKSKFLKQLILLFSVVIIFYFGSIIWYRYAIDGRKSNKACVLSSSWVLRDLNSFEKRLNEFVSEGSKKSFPTSSNHYAVLVTNYKSESSISLIHNHFFGVDSFLIHRYDKLNGDTLINSKINFEECSIQIMPSELNLSF